MNNFVKITFSVILMLCLFKYSKTNSLISNIDVIICFHCYYKNVLCKNNSVHLEIL